MIKHMYAFFFAFKYTWLGPPPIDWNNDKDVDALKFNCLPSQSTIFSHVGQFPVFLAVTINKYMVWVLKRTVVRQDEHKFRAFFYFETWTCLFGKQYTLFRSRLNTKKIFLNHTIF